MITYEQALETILAHCEPLATERRPLHALSGRFLAEPLVAAFDVPLFDNSAMDGFGVRVADVAKAGKEQPVRMRLCGTVQAGDAGDQALPPGMAVKVLTGAPVPPGVEAVIMQEDCEELGGEVLIGRSARPGDNIRRRGEEFRAGDTVLPAGVAATPAVVGLLATFGYDAALVRRAPAVGLVATGSELVQPGEALASGRIYDSNSHAICSALRSMRLEPCAVTWAEDSPLATRTALEQALSCADIVIILGGVSVGEYDCVRNACAELGVETIFWQVAIKPGKPVYFGRLGDGPGKKFVLGLPGNPVAALVTFHQFVRPALRALMGAANPLPERRTATLASGLRKKPGRLELVRGIICSERAALTVEATSGQGSHMLGGLVAANCLIHFPAEMAELAAGAQVIIDLLEWN